MASALQRQRMIERDNREAVTHRGVLDDLPRPESPPDRWATVPAALNWSVSRHRHRVRRGAVTSACGTTALPADTWQTNSRKPRCPECVQRQEQAQ